MQSYRIENEDVTALWIYCDRLVYKPDDCQLQAFIGTIQTLEYVVMDGDCLYDASTSEELNIEYFTEKE